VNLLTAQKLRWPLALTLPFLVGVLIVNRYFAISLSSLSEIAGAAILVTLAAATAYERFRIANGAEIPRETPSTEERVKLAKDLEALEASDEIEGALFILEESKASYQALTAANATIEGKASSLLTTIAGAAGLLSLFGRFKDGSPQAGVSGFLWLAIAAAAVAIVCCLYITRSKIRPFPSVAAYVLSSTVWDSDSRFHIALQLAESYNRDIIFIRRDRRFEGPAYYAAQIFLALAAVALVAHFAVPVPVRP
jgi:hypothetical protein